MIRALCSGALLLLLLPGPGFAQQVIGRVTPGQTLSVDLERTITTDRLAVEVDGIPLPGAFRTRGDFLDVVIPPDLQGVRHDLRVFVIRADGKEEIGVWLFETANAPQLFFGSIQADTGLRASESGTRAFATGAVRLEFEQGDGQARGRLLVSRDEDAGEAGRDEFSVDDVFLELRRPTLGRDLYLRLGNSDLLSGTLLLDESSRRGVTLRFADPAATTDLSAFVLGTERAEDLDNLFGLEDSGARVSGLSAILRPRDVPGLRFDVALYDGHARDLPDGTDGKVEGYGVNAIVPFADGRADFGFGLAQADWSESSGQAAEAEINWQLADPGGVQFLALGLEARRVGTDFYTPLNPFEIPGESSLTVSLDSINPTWQWRLEAYSAETNTDGPSGNPVDRLRGLSANVTFDPGDFTGGFLNGTLFFANAAVDLQDRTRTPAGAPDPEDNTLTTLSFGMEKLQPRYNWAWSVALDDLQDRADRDADRTSGFVSARLSLTPSPDTTAQFFVNTGLRDTENDRFMETEAAISLDHILAGGLWETGGSLGYLSNEDPALEDGRFVSAYLSRRLNDRFEVVARANWGRDQFVPEGVDDEGWSLELFIRTDFAFDLN